MVGNYFFLRYLGLRTISMCFSICSISEESDVDAYKIQDNKLFAIRKTNFYACHNVKTKYLSLGN